jgi:hypothetical protein
MKPSARKYRIVWILSFLFFSFSACAADNGTSELQNLYNALNMLNQEQQAIYQQFQMVQAMMSKTPQMPYGTQRQVQQMGDFPNYFDLIEARKSSDSRDEALYQQANKLMEQYSQIEEQKKPIRERIISLTVTNSK